MTASKSFIAHLQISTSIYQSSDCCFDIKSIKAQLSLSMVLLRPSMFSPLVNLWLRKHTENQLPRVPGCVLNICAWWWCVNLFQCSALALNSLNKITTRMVYYAMPWYARRMVYANIQILLPITKLRRKKIEFNIIRWDTIQTTICMQLICNMATVFPPHQLGSFRARQFGSFPSSKVGALYYL